LWKINLGTGFNAPPITFAVNGWQYVALRRASAVPGAAPLPRRPVLKEQRNATVLGL